MVIDRFANVVYWAACVLAVGWLVVCYLNVLDGGGAPGWDILAIVIPSLAALIWMVARAARYVIVGK
jgi:hypothetical protein